MSPCLCLKSNGQQCSRDSSKKAGTNAKYCWQHQTCQSTVNTHMQVPPTKPQVPPTKPQVPPTKPHVAKKENRHQKVNLKTIKGNEIRTLIKSGLGYLDSKYGDIPLDDYLYSNEEYDSIETNFEIMFNDCDLFVKAGDLLEANYILWLCRLIIDNKKLTDQELRSYIDSLKMNDLVDERGKYVDHLVDGEQFVLLINHVQNMHTLVSKTLPFNCTSNEPLKNNPAYKSDWNRALQLIAGYLPDDETYRAKPYITLQSLRSYVSKNWT
jgi:hypothetical protein